MPIKNKKVKPKMNRFEINDSLESSLLPVTSEPGKREISKATEKYFLFLIIFFSFGGYLLD